MRIAEEDLIKILIVRSTEEREPRFFSAAQLEEAESQAGEIAEGPDWIQRRSSSLFALLPESLRGTCALTHLPPNGLLLVSLTAFLVGVASNFLGPSASFRILYNPLIALVLWNVLVFLAFLTAGIVKIGGSGRSSRVARGKTVNAGGGEAPGARTTVPLRQRMWVSLWTRAYRSQSGERVPKESVLSAAVILRDFWPRYLACCGRLSSARIKLLFHVGALALIAGAVAGVYMRGVFFEYAVVWRSTFIRDPELVRILLNIVLAVPSYVVTGDFITPAEVRELMSAGGAPAAQWIHVLIVAALIFAVLPRLVLLTAEVFTLKTTTLSFMADTSDNYFAGITRRAWERKVEALRGQVDSILSEESSQFSDAIAAYVRDQLYDRAIVPRLSEFRDRGGRIADLESAIKASCEEFEQPLEGYIAAAQELFKASVTARIETVMGRQLSGLNLALEKAAVYRSAEGASALRGEDLTDTFAGVIHVTIATVITGTIATVSGGFGKSLGVAVISVLLHASGPVGWLVGAIIGLLVAGGVAWATKDRISDAVKEYSMPSFVTKRILSRERLAEKVEEGRLKIFTEVKAEVQRQLNQALGTMEEALLLNMIKVLKSQSEMFRGGSAE
ncbi:MAG: DUF2868 domain-containing protein [Chloroflexota bacterium]